MEYKIKDDLIYFDGLRNPLRISSEESKMKLLDLDENILKSLLIIVTNSSRMTTGSTWDYYKDSFVKDGLDDPQMIYEYLKDENEVPELDSSWLDYIDWDKWLTDSLLDDYYYDFDNAILWRDNSLSEYESIPEVGDILSDGSIYYGYIPELETHILKSPDRLITGDLPSVLNMTGKSDKLGHITEFEVDNWYKSDTMGLLLRVVGRGSRVYADVCTSKGTVRCSIPEVLIKLVSKVNIHNY